MCGAVILAVGAVVALCLGYSGFFKGRLQLTQNRPITGTAARTIGLVSLLLGLVLSAASVLWFFIVIARRASELAA